MIGWEVNNGLNPNVNDANNDPDSDGLTNLQEYQNSTNPNSSDTDSDGMPDGWEINKGLNPTMDDSAEDPDGDSLTNLQEYQHYTEPFDSDTDNDGLLDGQEVLTYFTDPKLADTDSDGMPDGWEVNNGLNPNLQDSSADLDNDGLTNLEEYQNNTDPNNSDTDSDGILDGWEVNNGLNPNFDDSSQDKDGDGLTNLQEYQNNTNPNNSDTDNDDLSDGLEVLIYLTNPNSNDTDSDGMPDGWEVNNNLDPKLDDSREDPDFDQLLNIYEFYNTTDPQNNDTDNDLILDGEECILGRDGFITNATNPDTDGDGFNDHTEISLQTNPVNRFWYPMPNLNVSYFHIDDFTEGDTFIIDFIIKNDGIWRADGTIIIIKCDSLNLTIYNNSFTPFSLDVDESIHIIEECSKEIKSGQRFFTLYADPNNFINETYSMKDGTYREDCLKDNIEKIVVQIHQKNIPMPGIEITLTTAFIVAAILIGIAFFMIILINKKLSKGKKSESVIN